MRPWRGLLGVLLFVSLAVGSLVLGPWPTGPVVAQDLDIKKVFPCAETPESPEALCDEARDIIMTACQGCHMFVRVARGRYEPERWAAIVTRMGERSGGRITPEQLEIVRSYLTINLGPDAPPPELPAVFDEIL